jgi:hypothetical protein
MGKIKNSAGNIKKFGLSIKLNENSKICVVNLKMQNNYKLSKKNIR